MVKAFFISAILLSGFSCFGQDISQKYFDYIKIADSLYKLKEYKSSGLNYSEAFKTNGGKGIVNDRYNAACSWAMASVIDSAFFQLFRIATKGNFTNHNSLIMEPDLNVLHADKRWSELLEIVKQNKEKTEVNFNKSLVSILDSIYLDDQMYRQQLEGIEKKYGLNSKELKNHWKIINEKDSINLVKVKSILDEYGWLGKDVISEQGNLTLFLVIQHSDQVTQEKYLPIMREAVKKGNAQGSSLALLEDRVALGQGRKQIYGSQIGRDSQTQEYFVSPLEDPDNVDKRRAEVGLQPLADYLNLWQIKWDVEEYKKNHKVVK